MFHGLLIKMFMCTQKIQLELMKEVSQFIVLLTMLLSITRAYTMLIARKRSTVLLKNLLKKSMQIFWNYF